jgi:hypothetical protein
MVKPFQQKGPRSLGGLTDLCGERLMTRSENLDSAPNRRGREAREKELHKTSDHGISMTSPYIKKNQVHDQPHPRDPSKKAQGCPATLLPPSRRSMTHSKNLGSTPTSPNPVRQPGGSLWPHKEPQQLRKEDSLSFYSCFMITKRCVIDPHIRNVKLLPPHPGGGVTEKTLRG